jgi:phage major head subunit gpT-like protein
MSQVYAPSALLKGAKGALIKAMLAAARSFLGRVGMFERSESDKEVYPWLGQPPRMRQIGGDDALIYEGMSDTSFELTNQLWASGIRVDRKDIDDQKDQIITRRIQELAKVGINHVNRMIVTAVVANGTGYDGVSLFNDAHPARGQQTATQDNNMAQSATTTAGVQTDIADAIEILGSLLAENNEPISEEITKVGILYPWAIDRQVREATKGILIGNTSNPMVDGFQFDLMPTARLTGTAFYVVNQTDSSALPIILQERDALELDVKIDGDDAFDNEIYKYKSRWRGVPGPGIWQTGVKVS